MLLDHAQACSAIARPLQMIVPIKFGVSPILLWLAYLQCDAECRLCLGFHILPRDPWLPFFQHQTLVGLDFERAEIGNAEFDQNFLPVSGSEQDFKFFATPSLVCPPSAPSHAYTGDQPQPAGQSSS